MAKGMDGAWRVKLFSDRGAVDYVRVLLFQNFAQLVDPNALNAPPLAGLNTAPEPTAQQAAAIGDDWRQFASACVRASRSKGEAPDFRPIAEMLRGIAGQERALMKELGAWSKRKG